MRHLGDITKISGYTAPTVDVVIGGSPCQDLSIAGKRAGLDGERSGLFMEQIRIIKEMRENDIRRGRSGSDVRPRYMVWENVPGAFSSNKGEDFQIVLEETAKVADKDAVIPLPDKGKWTTSGCIMGDGWSIAWRILDAQFRGVPQRRRRIALVADFGGQSAPEILFVRKSVSGDTEQSKQEGQGTSSDAERGTGADDCERVYCFEPGAAKRLGGYVWEDLAPTLRTEVGDNRPSVAYSFDSLSSNSMKSSNPHSGCREVDVAKTLDTTDPNPSKNQGGIAVVQAVPYTLKIRSGCEGGGKGALIQTDMSATLSTLQDQTLFVPVCYSINHQGGNIEQVIEGISGTITASTNSSGNNKLSVCYGVDVYNQALTGDKTMTMTGAATDPHHIPCTVYSIENHPADSRVDIDESGKVQTLTGRMGTGGGNVPMLLCMATQQGGAEIYEDLCPTITASAGMSGNNQPVIALDRSAYNQGKNAQFNIGVDENGTAFSCIAKGPGAVAHPILHASKASFFTIASEGAADTLMASDYKDPQLVAYPYDGIKYIVRRLTPLECERLQGFPDNGTIIGEPTQKVVEDFDEDTGEKEGEHIETEFYYTNSQGKRVKCSDAARYKALGNSIAIPPWKWVLKRLCACYERDATMASLFDGIGGFPLIWEQLNGKGGCLWASEIEEFPIAVTKVRFADEK